MWRVFKLFFIYGIVFICGYASLGVLLHFYKPTYHILPEKVENILDGKDFWEVQSEVKKTNNDLSIEMLHQENHDTSDTILFTDDYQSASGIFCFRGNAQRSAPSRGIIKSEPVSVNIDWVFETASDFRNTGMGAWGGGTGWTGQALVVEWPDTLIKKFKTLKKEFRFKKNLKEVIIGSLCGNIYFLDWNSGKETRPFLTIQNPIKGTISLDPRMNGLLYVGQGIKNEKRIGSYVFDIFEGKEMLHRPGLDYEATRKWGAFDSNPLIDLVHGYCFQPGENGLIYKAKFNRETTKIKSVKWRYKSKKGRDIGFESSMGAWNNLGVFGDNNGNVFCLNLMTMKLQWYYDNIDDTDASLVIDIEEGKPFVYLCNEVDKQGKLGKAAIRKVDLKTGKLVWQQVRTCSNGLVGGRVNSGGVLASVLPGKNKASRLLFGIYSRVKTSLAGEFVAIDKQSGKQKYSIPMSNYSWSSPLDVYDKKGNCYIFFTDVYGTIYLINGLNGKIIYKKKMDAVWESSPIAWGNRIVLGSRGNKIYSFTIETKK